MIYFITFLCDFLIQGVSIQTVMSFKKKKKSSKTITENFLKTIPAKALIKEIGLTMFQIRVNASFRILIIVFDQISCECIFMYGSITVSPFRQTSIASKHLPFQQNALQSKNGFFFGVFSRSRAASSSSTRPTYTQPWLGRSLSCTWARRIYGG